MIPIFTFFSESIILKNEFHKLLFKRNIFFIIEKPVYVRKGSSEPFEQLSLSKPLVFRRGIKGACGRWVHYKRLCNNMGWNNQRNSSLVRFLFFFSGDGTQWSARDPHCGAKKLQFVFKHVVLANGRPCWLSTAEPAICDRQSPLKYWDCHSVVTQRLETV